MAKPEDMNIEEIKALFGEENIEDTTVWKLCKKVAKNRYGVELDSNNYDHVVWVHNYLGSAYGVRG